MFWLPRVSVGDPAAKRQLPFGSIRTPLLGELYGFLLLRPLRTAMNGWPLSAASFIHDNVCVASKTAVSIRCVLGYNVCHIYDEYQIVAPS